MKLNMEWILSNQTLQSRVESLKYELRCLKCSINILFFFCLVTKLANLTWLESGYTNPTLVQVLTQVNSHSYLFFESWGRRSHLEGFLFILVWADRIERGWRRVWQTCISLTHHGGLAYPGGSAWCVDLVQQVRCARWDRMELVLAFHQPAAACSPMGWWSVSLRCGGGFSTANTHGGGSRQLRPVEFSAKVAGMSHRLAC
jgi:hypothetical protein